MTPPGIVIVGAGGSARETLTLLRDIIRADVRAWTFQGLCSTVEPEAELLDRIAAPALGDPYDLVARHPEAADWAYVVGIGNPRYRREMDAAMLAQGLEPATLIHPTALVGDDVMIGAGSVLCAYTVLTTNIRIGRSAQINIGCVIGHDARVGDYLTMAQSVNVAGNVTIGDDVTLHTQAMINRGLTVGSGSVVGSGGVVVRDVEPGVTVMGVPARRRP